VMKRFDTPANTAGLLLKHINSLVDLRLDQSTTATKFISDFEETVLKLRTYGAKVADDQLVLRAFLLRAIQDEEYKLTQDFILSHPESTAKEILQHLANREAAIDVIGDDTVVKVDGNKPPQTSRRGNTRPASNWKEEKREDRRPWHIPFYPTSWRKAFGEKLFELLVQWRLAANHKTIGTERLNQNFATTVAPYERRNDRPREHSRDRNHSSRRASREDTNETNTGTANEDPDTQASANPNNNKRLRITLQKSGRVITERKQN
jgi:hypothetical protein